VQAQPATTPATAPATIRNVAGIAGVALLLAAGLMLLRRSSRKPAQEPATVEAH
jgi:LPXTG-motif cell wall-anchored protein